MLTYNRIIILNELKQIFKIFLSALISNMVNIKQVKHMNKSSLRVLNF